MKMKLLLVAIFTLVAPLDLIMSAEADGHQFPYGHSPYSPKSNYSYYYWHGAYPSYCYPPVYYPGPYVGFYTPPQYLGPRLPPVQPDVRSYRFSSPRRYYRRVERRS